MKTPKNVHYIFKAALAAMACVFLVSQAAMAGPKCLPIAETCNGIDDDCDGVVDNHLTGMPAADSAGGCANWKCMGGSWTKEPVLAGTVCRPSAGECDMIDHCDGVQAGCPADEFAPDSRVCRSAIAGSCDKAEYCTGSSAPCPADVYLPLGTVCRAASATNACDTAEVCSGDNSVCPADNTPKGCSIGGVCYADELVNPANECEKCNYALNQNDWTDLANGTGCDDENLCTVNDTCQAGTCTPGTVTTCAAGNACHEAGVCNPLTGACSVGAELSCDDGKPCTLDSCNNALGCQHTPVTCAPADKCHAAGTCNPTSGVCEDGALTICPAADVCHAAGSCNPITGACVGDGAEIICPSDGNECTTDICKPSAGGCVNLPIANCGGGGDGCAPGNSRICEGMGVGGCYAKQICLPGGTWGECMFNVGGVCEDLAGRDACAITTSGRCTELGACDYTQMQNLCMNDDGCCPAACNSLNDNDCNAFCGNAVVETGEICEAASSDPDEICLARCDDGDVSTRDTMSGSESTCDVQCQFTPITECISDDGYCPEDCVFATDSNCPADEVVAEEMERGEEMILPAASAGVEFFSFCDGASEATKELNSEIKAIAGSSKVDLFCDYDARMIYIVMSKDDPLTRTWALIQKSGLPVLWADQYWKNPRYESVSTPVVIFSSKNNPATKSMTESMLSLSVPDYVEPVSNVKVIEDKPDRINFDNFVTYYSSVEADPSLTLANGDVVEFSRSAEEIAADNKYKQVFTVAFLKPSSFNTVGGPINPINEEDKLRDAEGVKRIISEKASTGQFDWNSIKAEDFNGVWQQEDVESFKVVGPAGEGGEISLNTIVGNRVESGPSCTLMSVKGTDLPAAIIILFLIAILPAGALSLARAVVKIRGVKK